MKLIKITFKNGYESSYIVKDDIANQVFFNEDKLGAFSHAGGVVRFNEDDVLSIDVLDKKVIMTSRTTNIPAGQIRVRRLRNPLDSTKHYENPCN